MDNRSERLVVDCAVSCGNAPKKELLRDLTVALAKKDREFCLEWMRDDIVWEIIGKRSIQGKDEFADAVQFMENREVEKLKIDNIITHGNVGSVNGLFIFADQSQLAFCDVYNFAGFGKTAKVKKITSYLIPL